MNQEKKETPGILVFRVIYPYLLYLLISLVVQMMLILPDSFELLKEMVDANADLQQMTDAMYELILGKSLYLSAISAVVVLPVLYFFYSRDKKYWPVKAFVEGKKQPAVKYIYIVLLSAVVSIAFNNLFEVIDLTGASEVYQRYEAVIEGTPFFWKFVATVVAAPFVEEMVFRGLIYKRLRRCLTAKTSIIISALAFGFTHGNVVQFLYAAFAGVLIAYVYEIYKSLWAPITFHITANLMSITVAELFKKVDNTTVRALIVAIELALVYGAIMLFKKKMANNINSEEEK